MQCSICNCWIGFDTPFNARAVLSNRVCWRSDLFQQVEDNLSALHSLESEAASQQRATAAAGLALKLTTNRFQAGAVSYLDVVTAQTIALTNERTADQIDARRLDASVLLLKALGGGWQGLTSAQTSE